MAQRIVRLHLEEERLDELRGGERDRQADRESDCRHDEHLAQHHPDQLLPLGAERHPQSDLVGPPRDAVRHRAVEPDAGDHYREQRERRAERREGPLLADGVVDDRFLRGHVRHRDPRVRLPHDLAGRSGQRQRIARRAQFEVQRAHGARLVGVREVRHRRHLLFERGVARVPRNSDDFHLRRARPASALKRRPSGFCPAK